MREAAAKERLNMAAEGAQAMVDARLAGEQNAAEASLRGVDLSILPESFAMGLLDLSL